MISEIAELRIVIMDKKIRFLIIIPLMFIAVTCGIRNFIKRKRRQNESNFYFS